MIPESNRALALVECGVASVTAKGQEESGDRHLVKTIPEGALLAVVDGSGRGPEAAHPARRAIGILEAYADHDITSLFQRCHQRLKATRGAVMGVAVITAAGNTLAWMGVGDVEGILLRYGSPHGAYETMLRRPGIVGYRLPLMQPQVTRIAPGDLIILATDGMRPDLARSFDFEGEPRKIAEQISSRYRKGDDDGLVLVARYLGFSQ